MLNSKKNMVERIPIAAVNAAMTVSALLRCSVTGLGASFGKYPPVTKISIQKLCKHATPYSYSIN